MGDYYGRRCVWVARASEPPAIESDLTFVRTFVLFVSLERDESRRASFSRRAGLIDSFRDYRRGALYNVQVQPTYLRDGGDLGFGRSNECRSNERSILTVDLNGRSSLVGESRANELTDKAPSERYREFAERVSYRWKWIVSFLSTYILSTCAKNAHTQTWYRDTTVNLSSWARLIKARWTARKYKRVWNAYGQHCASLHLQKG